MGRSEDRISNLSDHLVQSILSLIPLKCAVRTSLLSRRWRHLWQHSLISSTTLNFGHHLASSQSPQAFVATVGRYLRLHGDHRKLHKLRLLFAPYDQFLPDIDGWIACAATKEVEELELDLSQGLISCVDGHYIDGRRPYALPESFFRCKSLTHVSLSRCDFHDRISFTSFGDLKSLILSYVNVRDDMLESLLTDCPLLESLSLRNCHGLNSIRILGPQLRLRALTLVDCSNAYDLQISAPKIQSFHYFGQLFDENGFASVSELVDAQISLATDDNLQPGYVDFVSHFSNVRILTLCSTTLTYLAASEEFEAGDLQILFPNLQELQLVMKSMTEEHLTCIYDFLEFCPSPFLEKLFVMIYYVNV